MERLKTHINSLTDFSEDSWTILRKCLTQVEFKKGEKLLQSSEICNAIFFISSGLCKSFYDQDGKEVNTAFYFENEFSTNLKSLTSSAKSDYTIVACEKLKAVKFNKFKLLEAYKESHQIETFGRKVLELILMKQEEHANSFKLLTAKERFERLMANHPDFFQRVSLTQASSYLGISRETLSRFRGFK